MNRIETGKGRVREAYGETTRKVSDAMSKDDDDIAAGAER
jgi:hypothetical protein